MGEQGCTHEQRRQVADALSEVSLGQGTSVIPQTLNTQERKVLAHTITQHVEIHYSPASVPPTFRR
jgi:hypothetical protein